MIRPARPGHDWRRAPAELAGRVAAAARTGGTALLGPVLSVAALPWRIRPPRSRTVAFIAYGGGARHEFSCNPKYVLLALRALDPDLDLVWAVEDPQAYPELTDLGVRLVAHGSAAAFRELLTAQVVVSNGAYLMWFPFGDRQFVINTWHGGGAYKRLPGDQPGADPLLRLKQRRSSKVTDLFVSSSTVFTRELVRGAFGYAGEVAEVGMPRNDLLLSHDRSAVDARTRDRLGLAPDARTVLVAPTMRAADDPAEPFDPDALLAALERRYGGEWWILRRQHKLTGPDRAAPAGGRVLEVSDYPDMQELLSLADVLVSDYSSTIWDFILTGKPCLLYVPDLDQLRQQPGFYVDPACWGLPLAGSNADLHRTIADWEPEQYRAAARFHLGEFGSVESGRAAELIAERIIEVCK